MSVKASSKDAAATLERLKESDSNLAMDFDFKKLSWLRTLPPDIKYALGLSDLPLILSAIILTKSFCNLFSPGDIFVLLRAS